MDRWVGPSFTLSLNYEKPLGNNSAKGRLASREAERRPQQIETRRSAPSGPPQRRPDGAIAPRSPPAPEAGAECRQVRRHHGAVRGPAFRAGEATLIDTITTEQQATEADLAHIAAQQAVANLLAQLRFESGTLVSAGAAPVPTSSRPRPGGSRDDGASTSTPATAGIDRHAGTLAVLALAAPVCGQEVTAPVATESLAARTYEAGRATQAQVSLATPWR